MITFALIQYAIFCKRQILKDRCCSWSGSKKETCQVAAFRNSTAAEENRFRLRFGFYLGYSEGIVQIRHL